MGWETEATIKQKVKFRRKALLTIETVHSPKILIGEPSTETKLRAVGFKTAVAHALGGSIDTDAPVSIRN